MKRATNLLKNEILSPEEPGPKAGLRTAPLIFLVVKLSARWRRTGGVSGGVARNAARGTSTQIIECDGEETECGATKGEKDGSGAQRPFGKEEGLDIRQSCSLNRCSECDT